MRGVVPACRTQDTVSIFALTVADAAKVAGVTIAFDAEDAFARASAAPSPCSRRPRRSRSASRTDRSRSSAIPTTRRLYHACFRPARGARRRASSRSTSPPSSKAARCFTRAPGWPSALPLSAISSTRSRTRSMRSCAASFSARSEIERAESFEALYELAELMRLAEAEWAKMDLLLLADGRHDLPCRGNDSRPRRAQYESWNLHKFREPDGSRGACGAGGLPCRRHPFRRYPDRPGAV